MMIISPVCRCRDLSRPCTVGSSVKESRIWREPLVQCQKWRSTSVSRILSCYRIQRLVLCILDGSPTPFSTWSKNDLVCSHYQCLDSRVYSSQTRKTLSVQRIKCTDLFNLHNSVSKIKLYSKISPDLKPTLTKFQIPPLTSFVDKEPETAHLLPEKDPII